MLLLILLAVLGQTEDYNGNYTKDYSYPKNTSVELGKTYTEDYNSYAPSNYTKDYSYMQEEPTVSRYCQAGFFLESSHCKPCAAGKTTESAGSPYCYNCPSGRTSFAGMPGCFDCPAGKTAHSGSPMCHETPTVWCNMTRGRGAGGDQDCIERMYYENPEANICGPCDCSGCPLIVECVAGTFSVAGATMCEPCWPGSFSYAGQTTCTDCPPGTTSMQGSPALAMCTTMTATTKVAPINDDDLELVDDLAKGPLENAMELHNEAQNAEDRAQEAQRNAEAEKAEASAAYEHKIEAEKELHFAEERYEEVHNEKLVAEEAKYNAVERYEGEAREAEYAENEAMAAKEESDRAALRAYEASHAVKMQSEGEADEAVINAKIEQEEHFHAEIQYKEKLFEFEQEALEADQANEEAHKAGVFADQQNQEAYIARAEVMVAGSHRDIQKAEAEHAQHEADMALREHEVAEAHHENVIASKQRNEDVWDDMLENDCVDDPMGLVVSDPHKNCDDVGSESHWSCDHFDEDFNGHAIFIWEICPVSCNMCGADRDQYYEEHHHKEDEHDHLPECLKDCPFEGLDIEDPLTACPWWHAEGPEHNTESCFNDCSPGVMYYVEHHVQRVCHGGPDDNPLECAYDCPIENLDPHSAESFCPWFSEEKDNECFHDCSDKFLNMAQAHAEHTCYEYEIVGDKYTNYITEPIVGADGEYSQSSVICEAGYYRSSTTDATCTVCPAGMFSYAGAYECFACPPDLTSFPGAKGPQDCFVRAALKTDESYDKASYESEDKYDEYSTESAHTTQHSYTKELETAATVEPINYHNTPYPSAEYFNEDMPRTSVDPVDLTYNNEDMPRAAVDPVTYNHNVYESEQEYYTSEPSYPESSAVDKYEYSTEPEYNRYEPSVAQATDYYTPQPEFVNEEQFAGQPQYGELKAPGSSEYSSLTNMEGDNEIVSGSNNE